jgi:hypothetical protein
MPYSSGEAPKVGDYVKNHWEQPGTVTRVHAAQDEQERVCIPAEYLCRTRIAQGGHSVT